MDIATDTSLSESNVETTSFNLPCDDLACPTGWTCFESSCYKLQPTTADHPKHEKICSDNGGHLAMVTSPRTELVLYDLCPEGQDIWIGATHTTGGNSAWKWVSRDEVKTPIWGV